MKNVVKLQELIRILKELGFSYQCIVEIIEKIGE